MKIPAEKAELVPDKGLLIAGIRPEYFEDASVLDPGKGSTFRATVDVVEWLGNEAYAYIPFEAPPEVQEQLAQLERDLDGESLRTQLVISLDGTSKVAAGDDAGSGSTPRRCTSSTPLPARTSPSTSRRPARFRRRRRSAPPPDPG